MEKKLFVYIKERILQLKEKTDQRILVFLFFFLIASIFWFLNALGKKYNDTIQYPIRYINLPKNKILVNQLPNKLTLRVNTYGHVLFKYNFKVSPTPIVFDYSSYLISKYPGERAKYYILTNPIRDKLVGQLSADVEVQDILPDTLIFNFAEIVKKKVPVKADVKIELAKQFMLKSDIYTIPDSIEVRGPHILLDTLAFIKTKFQRYKDVNQSLRRNLGLQTYRSLDYDKKRTVVVIPVEQFTEGKLSIPIQRLNVPDSIDLKLFPSSISITYSVGLSDFDKVVEDGFAAFVDYDDIDDQLGKKIKVSLGRTPGIVRNVRYYPVNVEYLLERND